ncbi:hypothetical protein B296_00052425 [Ensete ventricosum]|uniref:Uncharacterized protein n=1 Tax=Ensete ventricosum TaxID=4639 RepID=A0A426X463_ENSVE|nr:hypothetical protein B296_00052425 [Ensete ventricosum]
MACETLSNIGAAITGAETWEFWISWKVTELFEIDAGDSSQDVDLGSNMSPAVAQLKLPATLASSVEQDAEADMVGPPTKPLLFAVLHQFPLLQLPAWN